MKSGVAILVIFVTLLRYGSCADQSYEVSFENYYDITDGDSLPQERPLVHLPTQGSFEGDNYVLNGSDTNIMRFFGIKYGNVPFGGRFKVWWKINLGNRTNQVSFTERIATRKVGLLEKT